MSVPADQSRPESPFHPCSRFGKNKYLGNFLQVAANAPVPTCDWANTGSEYGRLRSSWMSVEPNLHPSLVRALKDEFGRGGRQAALQNIQQLPLLRASDKRARCAKRNSLETRNHA